MIHEIDVAELIAFLSEKSKESYYSISYQELYDIGRKVESKSFSYRVNISKRSCCVFESRDEGNIELQEDRIRIQDVESPVYKRLIQRYKLSSEVEGILNSILEGDNI